MEAHTSEPIIANRYQLAELLGEGGSGSTYRAIRRDDGMEVAIKILSLRHLNDWKQLELFDREAKVLSQLDHPQIPQYLDYFHIDTPDNRAFYIVQQLAPGKPLTAWVQSGWRGTEAEIRDLASQLLGILQYLHSQSPPLIHRDLKPHNIIRNDDGRVFLVDFGAVQDVYRHTLLKGATVAGTYGYMSPEQFRGEAVPASDLYGLGATILYLLTHRSPAELPQERLKLNFRSHVNLSESFTDWLEMMLEPDTSDRFASAELAISALNKQHRFRKQQGIKVGFPWKGAAIAAAILLVAVPLIDRYRYTWLAAAGLPISGVCEAISQGNLKSVREYLDRGVGINDSIAIENRYGYDPYVPVTGSLLHCAIARKQNDIANFLLQNGANVNLQSKERISPLMVAVRRTNVDGVESLIKAGANPFTTDRTGRSLWHLLVENYYDYDRNNKNREIRSIAEQLRAVNLDINARDINGNTPLHLAVASRNSLAIAILLKYNAKTDLHNERGRTPLITAIALDDFDTTKLLLSQGIDPNVRDRDGKTPLMSLFAEHRALASESFLPQNFENTAIKKIDTSQPKAKILRLLLASGADPHLTDFDGNTALHLMVKNFSKIHPNYDGCYQSRSLASYTLDRLMKHKIDRRAVNRNGDTALHIAARTDFFPITDRLIAYGWNPKQKNKDAKTPLELIQAAKAAKPRATRCQNFDNSRGKW